MPALPAVSDVLRIQFKWTSSADTDLLTRIYWQYSGTAPTNGQLATMASTLAANMNTDFAGYWHSDVTLTECIITDLSSATAATGSASVSHAGTLTGTELPAGVAMMVNFSVARRYRGGKPRIYLPFGSSSEMATTQTWSSTFVNNVTSEWGGLQANIATAVNVWGSSVGQVNVSYYKGFAPFLEPSGRYRNISTLRTGGPVVDTITNATANTRFASQRRRNRP